MIATSRPKKPRVKNAPLVVAYYKEPDGNCSAAYVSRGDHTPVRAEDCRPELRARLPPQLTDVIGTNDCEPAAIWPPFGIETSFPEPPDSTWHDPWGGRTDLESMDELASIGDYTGQIWSPV
jgi:hypothetical protein